MADHKKTFSQIIHDHQQLIEKLWGFEETILNISTLLIKSVQENRTIFWYGNGGSASDAQHMAAELVGRFKRERRALKSIALTTDSSILTAVGNDYGYEHIFRRQVEAFAAPGDICIGLSTSGNSENVSLAHKQAKEQGATTISLLGNDGGKIKGVSDLSVVVPSKNTARIQEAHTLISHTLCDLVEQSLVSTS